MQQLHGDKSHTHCERESRCQHRRRTPIHEKKRDHNDNHNGFNKGANEMVDAMSDSRWLVGQLLYFKAFRQPRFHICHELVDVLIEPANNFTVLHFDRHHDRPEIPDWALWLVSTQNIHLVRYGRFVGAADFENVTKINRGAVLAEAHDGTEHLVPALKFA